MSAQTLRGQSKHKATLSNLLHPMLWHSCPNGSGLPRMTMNRVLAELFAQPYIDVKHMPGFVPVTRFHLTRTLMGPKTALSTFINKTPKGWNFSWRSGVASLKIKLQKVEACVWEKKEVKQFWQLSVIQHPIKTYCFCFLSRRVYWLSLKRLPTGHDFIQA